MPHAGLELQCFDSQVYAISTALRSDWEEINEHTGSLHPSTMSSASELQERAEKAQGYET